MNTIRFWNDVALEANRKDHSTPDGEESAPLENGGPTLSARALAMVSLAIHDAHFGARGPTRAYSLYLRALPPPAAALDADAAVAAAAATMLTALYPKQVADFRAAFSRFATGRPMPSDATEFGRSVAALLLETREDDVPDPAPYAPIRRDDHRPDPENPGQPFYGTSHGRIRPFALRSPLTLAAPRPLASAAETEKVRELGGAPEQRSTTRSNDQTVAAIYWAYDGANEIGTPPRLYDQILGVLSTQKANSADDDARLFALANTAMADAGFRAWGEKYRHAYWRPVVGVRESDPSTGPLAVPQKNVSSPVFWRPLGAPSTNTAKGPFTPPFPAYPSGHATFGAAAFQAARLFYGQKKADRRKADKLAFEFVSDELNGASTGVLGGVRTKVNRKFASLWEALRENAASRLWLGVHWEFDSYGSSPTYDDAIGGVPLGLATAEDIFDNELTQAP